MNHMTTNTDGKYYYLYSSESAISFIMHSIITLDYAHLVQFTILIPKIHEENSIGCAKCRRIPTNGCSSDKSADYFVHLMRMPLNTCQRNVHGYEYDMDLTESIRRMNDFDLHDNKTPRSVLEQCKFTLSLGQHLHEHHTRLLCEICLRIYDAYRLYIIHIQP